MANRIKGITIDIGANTVKLTDALKNVDKQLKSTQAELNDVNRLLKLDPKNTELLRQKQALLKSAIADTKVRQEELNKALEQMKASGDSSEAAIKQQNALKREIEATNASLKKYQSQLSETGFGLQGMADKTAMLADKTRALSAAAGAALVGLGTLAVKAGKTADDLNTLAQQTGFSTEELQKMNYAADRIDVSMETITAAASKMTKTLASSESKFTSLGVATRNSDGSFRDVNAIFYDTITALSQIENSTERDTAAMDIFGKSANELAGIIDDGGAALRTFGQEAEDAGLILSQDALNSAQEFNDKIDELKAKCEQAFLSVGAELADTLIPALEKLVETGTTVLSWVANIDSDTLAFIATVLGLVAALSPLLSAISSAITMVSTISSAISAAVAVGIPGLIAALGGILPVLAAIAAAGLLVYEILQAINQEKRNKEWDEYTTTKTAGMHQITADQAANWGNSSEVQTIINPAGEKAYYVKDSDYTWDKANSAANGWTDSGAWGGTTNNFNVNVQHVDDLQDLINMKDQAQQYERMGGVN